MTQLRKCYTCRARKVKCDEKQPVCGNCAKKGRECRYSHSGATVFVTERPGVRSKKLTCMASHVSYISGLKRPRSMPSNAVALLRSRWISMIGTPQGYSNSFQYFGTWLSDIPARIGSDAIVDMAISYVLDSYEARVLGTHETYRNSRLSGSRALKGVRLALTSNSKVSVDLLLAVKLLFVSEILWSTGNFVYALHVQQLSHLLQRYGPPSPNQGIEWSLYESLVFEEICEALLVGRDSVFDGAPWLASMHSSSSDASADGDMLSTTLDVMRNMIRLPRLVRLIRESERFPDDLARSNAAIELLQVLNDNDCEAKVQEILRQRAYCVPTVLDHAWVTPYSWHFDCYAAFQLVIFHYTYRVLLCGALERLHNAAPHAACIDLDETYLNDERAALSIAMCLDYAHSLDRACGLPLAALRLHSSLQISCGTWHRRFRKLVQTHQEDSPELQHAANLEAWCLNISNVIGGEWKEAPSTMGNTRLVTDALAGGRFQDFMMFRTDPAVILASQDIELSHLDRDQFC